LDETVLCASQLAERQMLTGFSRLGHRNSLRAVDARVAAEGIGHETGDGEIDQVLGAEQLNSHDGAGQGRIGGSGKHGKETEGGKEVHRCIQNPGKCVSQGGADEKEWRDLATLEACRQGDGR